MDLSAKDSDGHHDDHDEDVVGIYSVEDEAVEDDDYDDDDDDDGNETKSLLPAGENRMLRSFEKGARKVQWNDSIGNNLAEVMEFMPSRWQDQVMWNWKFELLMHPLHVLRCQGTSMMAFVIQVNQARTGMRIQIIACAL